MRSRTSEGQATYRHRNAHRSCISQGFLGGISTFCLCGRTMAITILGGALHSRASRLAIDASRRRRRRAIRRRAGGSPSRSSPGRHRRSPRANTRTRARRRARCRAARGRGRRRRQQKHRERRKHIRDQRVQRGEQDEEREQIDETARVVQRHQRRRQHPGDQETRGGCPLRRRSREDAREQAVSRDRQRQLSDEQHPAVQRAERGDARTERNDRGAGAPQIVLAASANGACDCPSDRRRNESSSRRRCWRRRRWPSAACRGSSRAESSRSGFSMLRRRDGRRLQTEERPQRQRRAAGDGNRRSLADSNRRPRSATARSASALRLRWQSAARS